MFISLPSIALVFARVGKFSSSTVHYGLVRLINVYISVYAARFPPLFWFWSRPLT